MLTPINLKKDLNFYLFRNIPIILNVLLQHINLCMIQSQKYYTQKLLAYFNLVMTGYLLYTH